MFILNFVYGTPRYHLPMFYNHYMIFDIKMWEETFQFFHVLREINFYNIAKIDDVIPWFCCFHCTETGILNSLIATSFFLSTNGIAGRTCHQKLSHKHIHSWVSVVTPMLTTSSMLFLTWPEMCHSFNTQKKPIDMCFKWNWGYEQYFYYYCTSTSRVYVNIGVF